MKNSLLYSDLLQLVALLQLRGPALCSCQDFQMYSNLIGLFVTIPCVCCTFIADPAYFTEGYAIECDALLDSHKIGYRRYVDVPLGPTPIRGAINYSRALPKPELRLVESAQSERKEKRSKGMETVDCRCRRLLTRS